MMKNLLRTCLLLGLIPLGVSAAELELDQESFFNANFTIDSAYTSDGQNYQISASGEAGPYSRVYLSYDFTDKPDLGDRGQFAGAEGGGVAVRVEGPGDEGRRPDIIVPGGAGDDMAVKIDENHVGRAGVAVEREGLGRGDGLGRRHFGLAAGLFRIFGLFQPAEQPLQLRSVERFEPGLGKLKRGKRIAQRFGYGTVCREHYRDCEGTKNRRFH